MGATQKFPLLFRGGDRFTKRLASKSGVVVIRVRRSQPPLRRSLNALRRYPLLA